MPTREEILRFVQEQSYPGRNVDISSDLVRDLGIDGHDADEFFEGLLKQFPLKLPAIDWSQHFHSEGELISGLYYPKLIAYKIGLSSLPPLRQLKPFTVQDLHTFVWFLTSARITLRSSSLSIAGTRLRFFFIE